MKLFENNYRSKFKLTSNQVFYWVYGMDTEESKRSLRSLLQSLSRLSLSVSPSQA